jgi:hypothetical protein
MSSVDLRNAFEIAGIAGKYMLAVKGLTAKSAGLSAVKHRFLPKKPRKRRQHYNDPLLLFRIYAVGRFWPVFIGNGRCFDFHLCTQGEKVDTGVCRRRDLLEGKRCTIRTLRGVPSL